MRDVRGDQAFDVLRRQDLVAGSAKEIDERRPTHSAHTLTPNQRSQHATTCCVALYATVAPHATGALTGRVDLNQIHDQSRGRFGASAWGREAKQVGRDP